MTGRAPMFRFEMSVDEDVFHDLDQRARADYNTIAGDLDLAPVVQWYQQEVGERLEPYPGPVVTPIDWTSDNQRAYYFAVIAQYDSEGNIIPYRRTFGLQRDWDVRLVGGTIIIENTNPAAKYVIGDRQQRFHANTGWPYAPDIVYDILVDTPAMELLANAWAAYWTRST